MSTFVLSILVLGVMGFVVAILLGLAADYFKVEVDPRVEEILKILPGANCGVCGYAGCRQFAESIVNGKAPITGCLVGKKAVADKIEKLMLK